MVLKDEEGPAPKAVLDRVRPGEGRRFQKERPGHVPSRGAGAPILGAGSVLWGGRQGRRPDGGGIGEPGEGSGATWAQRGHPRDGSRLAARGSRARGLGGRGWRVLRPMLGRNVHVGRHVLARGAPERAEPGAASRAAHRPRRPTGPGPRAWRPPRRPRRLSPRGSRCGRRRGPWHRGRRAADRAAPLRKAGSRQGVHPLVDGSRRDAMDPGLLDRRHAGLPRRPPRLQKARKAAALAQLRDRQPDPPGARLPVPPAVAVAVRLPQRRPGALGRTRAALDPHLHGCCRGRQHPAGRRQPPSPQAQEGPVAPPRWKPGSGCGSGCPHGGRPAPRAATRTPTQGPAVAAQTSRAARAAPKAPRAASCTTSADAAYREHLRLLCSTCHVHLQIKGVSCSPLRVTSVPTANPSA